MPDGNPWPKITIVTPSYNQGQFLEETIRSVLLQGYPNLEYIVIDGGSTDNSVDILRAYQPRLVYWVSEPDHGQCHAINKGFERATGDILAWLNSDDVYAPDVFTQVAVALCDKEMTMLVGSAILTDGPDELAGQVDDRKPSRLEMVYDGRSFPQPSVFWTSDLWGVAGPLDERLNLALDYDLWLRMRAQAKEEVFVDTILSYERTHPQQKAGAALSKGFSAPSLSEKAYVAANHARSRGEPALTWLARSWFRNMRRKVGRRQYASALFGSQFQHIALRQIASQASYPLTGKLS